jgi:DNA replication protein DnaC
MSAPADNLLERLARQGGDDDWSAVVASEPHHADKGLIADAAAAEHDQRLQTLLSRINKLAGKAGGEKEPAAPAVDEEEWTPTEPETFHQAGLSESQVEALLLKFLLARGDATGRCIAEHVKLPFRPVDELLRQLKNERLVAHRGAAQMNDFVYTLSDIGRERARRLSEECTYYGAAPVTLEDYIASVKQQSLAHQHPTRDDLKRAFADLLINQNMLGRLGPAINSGKGLFLFGAPGNGKTSIAERMTRSFGQHIWLPRAVGVDGDIIRLFDPSNHELAPLEANSGLLANRKIDARWVRIVRPTIVVGGELTMDNLEVSFNRGTGVSEAPLQMKSNCGTLVIDDFGRQKMSTDQLLNRWIVPLEKRYDFLNLPGGKKIQVPFDQLIVFSTNLEPKDLVDDAFLRRIPYKIEVVDPTEQEFRQLFHLVAPKVGITVSEAALDHLVKKHYLAKNRPFRCCQPRDLLLQVRNYCFYNNSTPEMTPETMDFAVENYFAVMQ